MVVRAEPGFMNCPVPDRQALLLTVKTVISRPFLQAERYEYRVWFDPDDLDAIQRSRWRQGRDGWLKLYRWKEEGVERIKIKPAGDTKSSDPLTWKDRSSSFFHFPQTSTSCKTISDPVILIYLSSILSERGWSESSPDDGRVHLCAFGKKQLHEVELLPSGDRQEPVGYTIYEGGRGPFKQIKRAGQVPISIYRIETRAIVTPGTEPEAFSLLGLEGDIEIHVDRIFQVPVRLKGRNRLLGGITLTLQEIVLP